MHSMHGMHTARLLTVSQHALHRGGGCIPACTGQGMSARGGCLPREVSAQAGVCLGGVSAHSAQGMSAWVVSASGPGGGGVSQYAMG